MRVVRVFADDQGESHFEDRDIPMAKVAYGRASQELATTAVTFRETDSGGKLDFHNPPRRQFIIFLKGLAELEASDGMTRRLGAGDVLLADDTTGRGHRLRDIEGRTVVFVPVPGDLDVDSFTTPSGMNAPQASRNRRS
jgi:quercetin dioxygenase-like cupin family protein